jgi:hypothetical protein
VPISLTRTHMIARASQSHLSSVRSHAQPCVKRPNVNEHRPACTVWYEVWAWRGNRPYSDDEREPRAAPVERPKRRAAFPGKTSSARVVRYVLSEPPRFAIVPRSDITKVERGDRLRLQYFENVCVSGSFRCHGGAPSRSRERERREPLRGHCQCIELEVTSEGPLSVNVYTVVTERRITEMMNKIVPSRVGKLVLF